MSKYVIYRSTKCLPVELLSQYIVLCIKHNHLQCNTILSTYTHKLDYILLLATHSCNWAKFSYESGYCHNLKELESFCKTKGALYKLLQNTGYCKCIHIHVVFMLCLIKLICAMSLNRASKLHWDTSLIVL